MASRDYVPLPDTTTSEDCIVDVDGFSSSDNELSSRDGEEIDLGDEGALSGFESEGYDYGEAEGGGGKKKSDHHNELEKRRRRTLNASYADLKKMVKRLQPGLKGGAGRDRFVETAARILKTKLENLRKRSLEAKELLAVVSGMPPGKDEEERKEIQEHIRDLSKASEMKIELRKSGENHGASRALFANDDEDDSDDDEWEDNEEEHNSEEENCPIDDDLNELDVCSSPESSMNEEEEEDV